MTLARDALVDRLDEGLCRRLSLITAPPGYGKTILAAQWRARLLARGVHVAWLSAADTDGPDDFRTDLARALGLPQSEGTSATMAELLEALGNLPRPAAILIDDFDRARAPDTEAIVRALVDHAPDGVHLLVASRWRCNIGAPSWRARGEVIDLGAEELAFDFDEMQALIGDKLSPSALGMLADQSAGWPIVAGMVWSHAERCESVEQGNIALRRAAVDVAEFMETEILRECTEHDRLLLAEASLFGCFNDALMEAIGSDGHAPRRIEALAEARLAVSRCGPDAKWLCFNPLLRRHLLEQASHLTPDRRGQLQAQAARFFAEVGDLHSAIRHARQAGDLDFVADLVEQGGVVALSARQGMSPLRELLDGMPQDFAQRHPHLRLGRVLLIAKDGRVQEARQLLHQALAERTVDGIGLSVSQDAFDQDCVLIDQLLAYYEDAVVSDEQLSQMEARARELAEDPWLSGWTHNVLFMAHFGRGNILAARVAAKIALERYRDTGNLYPQIIMRGHLAALDVADVDLAAARDQIETARAQAAEQFPDDNALIALIDIPYAEMLRELGESERAKSLIARSLEIVEGNEGWVDLFARGYRVAFLIALASGDAEAAEQILARFERTAHERGLDRLRAYGLLHQMELAIVRGDIRHAVKLRGAYGGCADRLAQVTWRERQLANLVFARLALAEGDLASAHVTLSALEDEITERGPRWYELTTRLLRTMLFYRSGMLDEAAAHMRLALNMGASQARRRAFLDEGEALITCLVRVARHAGLASFSPEAAAFLAAVVAAQGEDLSDKADAAPRIFSPRELQVLRELTLGKANKVIARALNLTEATVKFHLAHIYEKLGVNNRMLAAAVARERGLVD